MAFAVCISCFFILACSSDNNEENDIVGLKSTLTSKDIAYVNNQLMKFVTPKSRAYSTINTELSDAPLKLDISESQAKEVCTPYLNDGKVLQSQMIKEMKIDGASLEDIQYITSLSEEKLVLLSFVVSNLQNYEQSIATSVSKKQVLDCLWYAIGIGANFGSYINGTKSLANLGEMISWRFALQLCRTMALRYIGFIGAAVCIYDFIDCM